MEKGGEEMGRPPKKEYESEEELNNLLHDVVAVYDQEKNIKAVALEMKLSEVKVKKLLITSHRLVYPQTEEIQELLKQGKSIAEVMELTGLSRASINGYLPYSKVPYQQEEVSANADRCELYRKRKEAVTGIVDTESLWNTIILFQNYPFKTATGLPFQYKIKVGRHGEYTKELWIDRRGESKSLTMSTVERAYEKAVEMKGAVITRPKALGDLRGISYIYPIFYRFGLIAVPDRIAEKMKQ